MRTLAACPTLFVSIAFGLGACSGTSPSDTRPTDAGTAQSDSATATTTWSGIYATYMGPGTPGHCGNSACHGSSRAGFLCGATKDTCYQGLVAASLVDPTAPATSRIIDPLASPLAWFGGAMPQDNRTANADAAAALKAWIANGGKND